MAALCIHLDASFLVAALEEARLLAPRILELDFERLGETGDFALELLNGSVDPGKYIASDSDSTTCGAGATTVLVKPSKLLLDLLSALRAVQGEVDGIEHAAHGDSFPVELKA